MAIPDYQTIMLPLLQFLKDGKERNHSEVVDSIADTFKLSTEERQQLLGSGQQIVIRNRAGWARTYLKKAGLLESTRRSFFRITERGQSVLASKPQRIDVKYLEQFPSSSHSESCDMSDRMKLLFRLVPPPMRLPKRPLTLPMHVSD